MLQRSNAFHTSNGSGGHIRVYACVCVCVCVYFNVCMYIQAFLFGDDSSVTHIPEQATRVAQVCTLSLPCHCLSSHRHNLVIKRKHWHRRPAMLIMGMIQPSKSDVIRRNCWEGRSLDTLQMDCFI